MLETAIGKELHAAGIPGVSIAAIDRRGHVEAIAVGMANVRAERRTTPQTAYHLFSGTKLYTATAVLQLVEMGRVALDAPAATYLPDVLGTCRTTVRQLLNHTSGLADTPRAFFAVHAEGEPAPSTAAALRRYRIRPLRPPGKRVEYRNVNFALLGELVSRTSGVPYVEHVTEQILKPLGMPVAFTTTAAMRGDVSTGYVGAWDPLRIVAPWLVPSMSGHLFGARFAGLVEVRSVDLDTAAAGGLVGPVVGFLPFVKAQLGDGRPLLRAETLREMQTLSARGAAGVVARVGTGLGWKIGQVGETRFLNHEGGGPGFASETRLYPAEGLGIVVCMNRWLLSGRSHLVAHRICELLRQMVIHGWKTSRST
jgi:D-alanyl-D-alanine carboxypeptidase